VRKDGGGWAPTGIRINRNRATAIVTVLRDQKVSVTTGVLLTGDER
jgi:hypothetical protein